MRMNQRIHLMIGFIPIIAYLCNVDVIHSFTLLNTVFYKENRSIRRQQQQQIQQSQQQYSYHQFLKSRRYLSSSNDNQNNQRSTNSINNNLSASNTEKREEEKRRLQRVNDVVIGKTSALPGEKDYELNIAATQELYLQQATALEREIYQLTELGMSKLKTFQLIESDQYFNQVFILKPNAYVWQAGIVKFYLNHIYDAAIIFSKCANIYESKFGEPATEERIWRHACALKLYHQMSRQEKKDLLINHINKNQQLGKHKNNKLFIGTAIDDLVPPIPISEYTTLDVLLRAERRKVMRITRDLYSSSIDNNHGLTILSRAKLRSMGSTTGVDTSRTKIVMDHKLWKLNSLFYLGLHYDCIGNMKESKQCLKNSLRLCPSTGIGNDIIHTLPILHMTSRDWYDEEKVNDDEDDDNHDINQNDNIVVPNPPSNTLLLENNLSSDNNNNKRNSVTTDNNNSNNHHTILSQSIKSSIEELKLSELQDSMRARNLKIVGSKDELKDRLYHSLITDPDLFS